MAEHHLKTWPPLYRRDLNMDEPTKPIRVQRKRTKGWKMPADTVYVGRPTRWGNNCTSLRDYQYYAEHKARNNPDWLKPLRGMNLACWCALNQPCHADILLRLANKRSEP